MKYSVILGFMLFYQAIFGQQLAQQFAFYKPFNNAAASAMLQQTSFATIGNFMFTGHEGAPRFFGASMHFNTKKNTYLGGNIRQATQGLSSFTQLDIPITQNFNLTEKLQFAVSLSPGFSFYGNRLTEANLNNPNDPEFSANQPLLPIPVTGFGSILYTSNFYIGFSVPNLITTDVFFTKGFNQRNSLNPQLWNTLFMLGYNKTLNDKISLELANQTQLGGLVNLNSSFLGQISLFEKVNIGAIYGLQNSQTYFIQLSIAPKTFFGYALQQRSINKLQMPNTHEVSIAFGLK